MAKIKLGNVYVTRFGEEIHWKSMSIKKQICLRRAIACYNRKPNHLAFIDWMIRQPEIMEFFQYRGLRLKRIGRKSKMYEICSDLLFRITRAEGITGRIQNSHLQ